MNKYRRGHLRIAIDLLNQAKQIVDKAQDEEDDALSGMPESMEYTDRYAQMENAVDCLGNASDSIDEALEQIGEAIQ